MLEAKTAHNTTHTIYFSMAFFVVVFAAEPLYSYSIPMVK